MKNKGFTLIELLIVISILGVVGTVVTISLTKSINDQHQKECDAFVKELEDAACVYAGLTRQSTKCRREECDPLSVKLLVREGLVSSEIDDCTGKTIEDDYSKTVTVSWDSNGQKSCTYNGVKEYAR